MDQLIVRDLVDIVQDWTPLVISLSLLFVLYRIRARLLRIMKIFNFTCVFLKKKRYLNIFVLNDAYIYFI